MSNLFFIKPMVWIKLNVIDKTFVDVTDTGVEFLSEWDWRIRALTLMHRHIDTFPIEIELSDSLLQSLKSIKMSIWDYRKTELDPNNNRIKGFIELVESLIPIWKTTLDINNTFEGCYIDVIHNLGLLNNEIEDLPKPSRNVDLNLSNQGETIAFNDCIIYYEFEEEIYKLRAERVGIILSNPIVTDEYILIKNIPSKNFISQILNFKIEAVPKDSLNNKISEGSIIDILNQNPDSWIILNQDLKIFLKMAISKYTLISKLNISQVLSLSYTLQTPETSDPSNTLSNAIPPNLTVSPI